ncbi:hypothetical protein LPJ78_002473 [Coemansia sp. RSA 989]|nr:hypothetical protein LPJ68_001795 [Coemansia sp. RSA 1086]KAJ1751262.1 hypothetical protein LPJ79_002214 [Coemansia sp. RSA 1821]KAJ1865693.1 hypothetical protein LPJ78_002473 [Coemansia sp. RSA 989]KAJ1872920.1 hypothetical protein LPJ55_002720 [Coemansia sp. RSA 990]KAJ2672099.1 hypothetical protein IWW42_003004 [Coemansia sp. RSA 1085]
MERDSEVETVMADEEWLRGRRHADTSSFDEDELFSSSGSLSSLHEFSDDDMLSDSKSSDGEDNAGPIVRNGTTIDTHSSEEESDGSEQPRARGRLARRRKVRLDDPNYRDDSGCPQLVYFAARGDTAACRRLLGNGADINIVDSHGWSALHEAAKRGHHATMQLLLSSQQLPNVNAITPHTRQTPLHQAVSSGNIECVRLLLENGANATPLNSRRLSPLDICSDEAIARMLTGHAKTQRLIAARDKAGQTKLHRACSAGDLDAAIKLLNQGADYNVKDNAGWTPLHEAALEGHNAVAVALLRRGADYAARGFGGDTPLHDACANGHIDVVRSLLNAGADALLRNKKGTTPEDMARDEGHSDILQAIAAHRRSADSGKEKESSKDKQENVPGSLKRLREEAEAPQVNYYHSSSSSKISRDERKLQVLMGTIERMERHENAPRSKRPKTHKQQQQQQKQQKKQQHKRSSPPKEHSLTPAAIAAHAIRFLPLYTVQLRGDYFVVDLQVRLLLGMSVDTPAKGKANPLFAAYPHLVRERISVPQKERLWEPLAKMFVSNLQFIGSNAAVSKESASENDSELVSKFTLHEKSQFVKLALYFVKLDEVVDIIRQGYPQISKQLITITLDLGSSSKPAAPPVWRGPQPMMPLKYALKLHYQRYAEYIGGDIKFL